MNETEVSMKTYVMLDVPRGFVDFSCFSAVMQLSSRMLLIARPFFQVLTEMKAVKRST